MNSQDRHYIFENFDITSKFHLQDHHETVFQKAYKLHRETNIAIFSAEKKRRF